MTNERIIAVQAKEIEEQKERIERLEKASSDALLYIYCIGGPLNDNGLCYSKPQMVTFARIAQELESA